MKREKILTLILAGGVGGRLDVLTAHRAKPALPFGGTLRLIDFSLSNCLHSGLTDVWVIEQYQLHTLNDHLANGRPWDLDRTYGGLQVLPPYAERGESDEKKGGFAEGNADAIYRQRRLLREFDPDLIVVLSADHIYKLDYREVIERHHACGAEVTMVTTGVPADDDTSRFGVVEADGSGRVTGFEYKPEHPRSHRVTAEVFVYDARRLLATLDELAEESGGELEDFGDALLPRFVERGKAWEYRLESYWRDVGTPESYWQAHMDLLDRQPELALDDPAWPILTYGAQRLPARLLTGAQVDDCLLAPGCTVAGRVTQSVLAPGVVVEPGAEVHGSILLHGVRVEAGARICRTVVDEEAVVAAGATVGAETGDLTLVGRGAQVAAGRKVAAGEHVALTAGPGGDHGQE